MKKLIAIAGILAASVQLMASSNEFVKVDSNGQFTLCDKPYRFIGTNLWYGPILASEGPGGDRQRLMTELDSLQAMGVDNLRVLAGGDGNRTITSHIEPNLQLKPGVYDQNLLQGLDFFLAELERRQMKAVIYLTNSWEWSGGYGTYLEWAGHGECPLPNVDGYEAYVNHARKFVADSAAKAMYADHVRAIVSRVNTVTGKPYSESPAIMSWQICNEPRCFDRSNKALFKEWLIESARLIKSIDPNHLVSTGSEGKYGCEVDLDLWAEIHNSEAIDYANIHIWPYNWRWVTASTLTEQLPQAISNTAIYLAQHRAKTSKPLVLEEFGYPRDDMKLAPGSPVTARDVYYRYVFSLMDAEESQLNGVNFWGWGGDVTPQHETWLPGDVYTSDPAQEPQGLYSVFAADSTTVDAIRQATRSLK